MRMRLRSAALFTVAAAITAVTVTPALAASGTVATWSADLEAGDASGVDVGDGSARLDQAHAFVAPLDHGTSTEGGQAVPTGLLTLPAQNLTARTDRVESTVVGDVPRGSTASVDVRGLRANGNWTEWIPSSPEAGKATTTLPEATSQVQARLVLTGVGPAVPAVSAVTFTAKRASSLTESVPNTEGAPLNYRVFATREGLSGSTTANGHVIANRDHFVALPSRRALSPNGKSDYSVKVCAPSGTCAFAPVWDVGPWNTKDDYWNPSAQRQQWTDLPQGTPEAQAAYKDSYNGGKDQYNRQVANPAGIDLGDGIFWDALGLKNNSYVTVSYLWTGDVRLSKVVGNDPVDVLAAPDAAAKVVGIAAEGAAVPVECALTAGGSSWLQIGVNQFVAASAVPQAGEVGPCAAASTADPSTATSPTATSTTTPATTTPDTTAAPATGTPATPDAARPSTAATSTATIPKLATSKAAASKAAKGASGGASATATPDPTATPTTSTATPTTAG